MKVLLPLSGRLLEFLKPLLFNVNREVRAVVIGVSITLLTLVISFTVFVWLTERLVQVLLTAIK